MELAELLEHEGLDPDDLMPWAQARANALVADLVHASGDDPLVALLDGIAVAAVEFEIASMVTEAPAFTPLTEPSGLQPLAGAEDLPPPPEPLVHVAGQPEAVLETFDTAPVMLGVEDGLEHAGEFASPNAETVITEIPVAPDVETVVTGIPVASIETVVAASPYFDEVEGEDRGQDQDQDAGEDEVEDEVEDGGEDDDEDDLEELELDELVELDDEELVELDDEPEAAPPPPPPPPPDAQDSGLAAEAVPIRSGDTATGLPVVTEAIAFEPELDHDDIPIRSGDTAAGLPIVHEEAELSPVQTGGTASFPTLEAAGFSEGEGEGEGEGEDEDSESSPIRTGATAAHAVLAADESAEADEDELEEVDLGSASSVRQPIVGADETFELDFDDD